MVSSNRNKIKGNSSIIFWPSILISAISIPKNCSLCALQILSSVNKYRRLDIQFFYRLRVIPCRKHLRCTRLVKYRCRRYPKCRVIVRGPPRVVTPEVQTPRRCRRQKRFVYTFYRGRAHQPRLIGIWNIRSVWCFRGRGAPRENRIFSRFIVDSPSILL